MAFTNTFEISASAGVGAFHLKIQFCGICYKTDSVNKFYFQCLKSGSVHLNNLIESRLNQPVEMIKEKIDAGVVVVQQG